MVLYLVCIIAILPKPVKQVSFKSLSQKIFALNLFVLVLFATTMDSMLKIINECYIKILFIKIIWHLQNYKIKNHIMRSHSWCDTLTFTYFKTNERK